MATTADNVHEPITTADGVPLKTSLNRARRRSKMTALILVAPLFLFLLFSFLVPIFEMLWRSVENPAEVTYMPHTVEALKSWNGEGVPSEGVFAALVQDLQEGYKTREIGKVAARLNYEQSGTRGLIMKSARHAKDLEVGHYKEGLIKVDKKWGEPEVWSLLKREAKPYTSDYYLAAVDMHYNDQGDITAQPKYQQIYVTLFFRTLWVSLLITALCIVLGYPIAFLLATLPLRTSNLLMIMVLLPFWTSLLVRTTSWIVMLQREGVVNDILVALGLLDPEHRIQMIYNLNGTIVAMTHILLPFMVLPLYSVMKTIPPSYMRAARSLGANPFRAFWKVYVPQTIPGVGAGSILVFILAIGYYITPALVGGRTGQLISNYIAYHMQESLNWGLAAAIGSILLAAVLALYWLYNRLVGVDNMKLG